MQWHLFIRAIIRSYALVWVVFLVGITLTVWGSASLQQKRRATDQARFDRAVEQTVVTIRARMRQYGLAASSLADFFSARESVSQPEWRFRIQSLGLEQNYPGLLEAGFATLETGSANAARAGIDSTPGQPKATPEVSFQVLHAWVRPPSAMGGVDPDFLEVPDQATNAWQAVTGSTITLSGMRQLSAEIEGVPALGFSIFAPVCVEAVVRNGIESAVGNPGGARYPKGVSFCAVEPKLLLETLFGLAQREIDLELFTDPKKAQATAPAFRAYISTNLTFPVFNQTWSIHCHTTPLFEREASLARPWVVLPLGFALTLALTGLLAIQIQARIQQGAVATDLRAACDELQRVQNEGERVSRELHDGVIQSLYLHQLTLGRCERLLRANVAQALEILAQGKSDVDDLIAELRSFLLRDEVKPDTPVSLEEALNALKTLVRQLGRPESVRVRLALKSSAPTTLRSSQLAHLKRIAQEAISNSLRHARARNVRLTLAVVDSALQLEIVDDGQGFALQGAAATGNGLANMQARAAYLGGTLNVESSAGHGTTVVLTFPLAPPTTLYYEQAPPR